MDIDRNIEQGTALFSNSSDVFARDSVKDSRFSNIFQDSEATQKDSDCIPKNLLSESEDEGWDGESCQEKENKSLSYLFDSYEDMQEKEELRKTEEIGEFKLDAEIRKTALISLSRDSSVYIPQAVTSRQFKSDSHYVVVEPKEGGGWRCGTCNLFNFDSFLNCHRCGKVKTSTSVESDEANSTVKGRFSGTTPFVEAKKKLPRRDGDWFCTECRNLNFSFRLTCNRCNQSKLVSGVDCIPRRSTGK